MHQPINNFIRRSIPLPHFSLPEPVLLDCQLVTLNFRRCSSRCQYHRYACSGSCRCDHFRSCTQRPRPDLLLTAAEESRGIWGISDANHGPGKKLLLQHFTVSCSIQKSGRKDNVRKQGSQGNGLPFPGCALIVSQCTHARKELRGWSGRSC